MDFCLANRWQLFKRADLNSGSMKLLYLTMPLILIIVLASCVRIWAGSEKAQTAAAAATDSASASALKSAHLLPIAEQRAANQFGSLISFDASEKDINLGLNYLMPFVEMPVQHKSNAPPRPLVIINSAAIASCGLVAASGLVVGYLIRSLGLGTVMRDPKSGNSDKPVARGLLDEEQDVLQLFDNFKLVYRNASGERVETRLPSLINTIESDFLESNINLPICMLKSICALIHRVNKNVRQGQATDMELLLEGATSWSWLLSWLEHSAVREAIEAGRTNDSHFCGAKYARCNWPAPEQQLMELLEKNVQFK